MKKTIIAGMFISLLGGCAALQDLQRGQYSSYVAPEISPAEIDRISADLTGFLAQQLPPGRTTLAFKPELTLFHDVFLDELASRGYGIATAKAPEDAVHVEYYLTILDGGILARINYKDRIASRHYRRTEQGLSVGNFVVGVIK